MQAVFNSILNGSFSVGFRVILCSDQPPRRVSAAARIGQFHPDLKIPVLCGITLEGFNVPLLTAAGMQIVFLPGLYAVGDP